MSDELVATLGVLFAEFLLFGVCYVRAKRPPNLARPRILPYGLIMLFLGLAIFTTAAHTVSVVTGHRLEGRNKMKGQ